MVNGAPLAYILDDDQSWKTFANSIYEMLVRSSAWIDSNTHLHDRVILITIPTFTANSIDGHITLLTIAVESIPVENFINAAAVASRFVAVANFYWSRFTSWS